MGPSAPPPEKPMMLLRRIQHDAREIQRLSRASSRSSAGAKDKTSPRHQRQASPIAGDALVAIQKLCGRIVRDVDKFRRAGVVWPASHPKRRRDRGEGRRAGSAAPYAPGETGKRPAGVGSEDKRGRWCLLCGCVDTPCWRSGPEGPETLCNVCGLLYAKRRIGRPAEEASAQADT